jgi:hypothetical protein
MPTAVERIALTQRSLAGSDIIGPFDQPLSWMTFQMNLQVLRTGGSLKVIGPVSSQVRSAMLENTILPKVEIKTPNGTVLARQCKDRVDPALSPARHGQPFGKQRHLRAGANLFLVPKDRRCIDRWQIKKICLGRLDCVMATCELVVCFGSVVRWRY